MFSPLRTIEVRCVKINDACDTCEGSDNHSNNTKTISVQLHTQHRLGRRKMADSHTKLPQLSVIEALDKLKLAVSDGGTPDDISFDFQRCKDYVINCAENAPKDFESRVRRDHFSEALIGSEIRSDVLRRPKRQKMEVSDAELSVVAGR